MRPLCLVTFNRSAAEISRSPLFSLLQQFADLDLANEIDLWFLTPPEAISSLTSVLGNDFYKPAILPYDAVRGLSPLVKALRPQLVLHLDGSTAVWTAKELSEAAQFVVSVSAPNNWLLQKVTLNTEEQESDESVEQTRASLLATLIKLAQPVGFRSSTLSEHKSLLARELAFWAASTTQYRQELPSEVLPAPRSLYSGRLGRVSRSLANLTTPKLGMLNQYVPRPIRVPPPTSLSATNLPSIAIVTPSYNQAAYIAKTMESVLSHNYPKLQYVVQDGGSTDATPDLLDRYAPRLSHAESAKDAGQADAINRGFARTTGEIMAYLNSDDLLLPGTLQYVGAFFAAHPEVDVIYGHRIVINENDQDVGRWLLPAHDSEVLSWADYVPQETLFWRRSVWEKAGGAMDESFRFALDWDLILRFRETGATFKRLPRFLGAFRIHTQQKTSKDMLTIGQQEMFRLRQRALGRQVTQGEINERIKPYLERHLWEHVRYRLSTRILASQYITFTPEPTSIST